MFGVYVVDEVVCELYAVGSFDHAAGYAQVIAEGGDRVLVKRVDPGLEIIREIQFQAWVDSLFGAVQVAA